MLDKFEVIRPSYELISLGELNLYQLESIQCQKEHRDELLLKKVDEEIQSRLKINPVMDEVFHCLDEGIKKHDEMQVTWCMARIPNLIHVNTNQENRQKRANVLAYPHVSPDKIQFSERRSLARQWLAQNDDAGPIPIASGTEGQRIYLMVDKGKNEFSFVFTTYDPKYYQDNWPYYQAFLKCFGVDNAIFSSDSVIENKYTRLKVVLGENKQLSKLEVNMK